MIRFFVKRFYFTLAIFFVILIFGVVSLFNLPIDILPDIKYPAVSIITNYSGASAKDVEKKVTEVLESYLSTISNVKSITSTSSEGSSQITLFFEWGTDIDAALPDVRDKIDFARRFLPDDVEKPFIFKFDLSLMPILVYGFNSGDSVVYDKLLQFIDDNISPQIQRLEGVGSVMLLGGHTPAVNVLVDPAKLAYFKIPLQQVQMAISTANYALPVGVLKEGKTEYNLRVPGEFENIDQLKNLIIAQQGKTTIRLRDIAKVEDSYEKVDYTVRVNGKPGVMMVVQKQSGANTVKVAKDVSRAMDKLVKILPTGVGFIKVMDSSTFIRLSINNLAQTLLWALVVVVFIVMLFLGNFRGSFIIALAIPFSLIVALIYLYASGSTINIITLSSLAIALGMVVDNSIVVIENIFRHKSQKEIDLQEAATSGTKEIVLAITASTLTTIAIFIPIFFIKGIVRELFEPLAYSIMIVLTASLFTAVSLAPTLAARILRKKSKKSADTTKITPMQKITRMYVNTLDWAITHKKKTVLIAVALFLTILPLIKFMPTEFMPRSDEGRINFSAELKPGTRYEESLRVALRLEKRMQEAFPELIAFSVRVGSTRSGFLKAMGTRTGSDIIVVMGHLSEHRQRTTFEINRAMEKLIKSEFPEVRNVVFNDQSSSSLSGGKPISIELYGDDFQILDMYASKVMEIVKSVAGTYGVDKSYKEAVPEIALRIDRDKLGAMGIDIYSLANTLRTYIDGRTVSRYRTGSDEYDIILQLDKSHITSLSDLKDLYVMNKVGIPVQLSELIKPENSQGPIEILRVDRKRTIKVEANIVGVPLGVVTKEIKQRLNELNFPSQITYKFAGEAEDQASSFKYMLYAVLLGIVLVYLVMVAQFESLLDPFVVMFSVPFAIIGVIWAVFVTGVPFSIMSFVGMLMLVGIVVNNAIVLVDFINQRRQQGYSCHSAIIEAGRERLRPILMTALTTMFGLLPMALSNGRGAEMWKPLGISVIGGLLVSTLVTLFIVPTIYAIFELRLKKTKKEV